ncbi:hypothetical protein BG006_002254 [Podila minutissima]|uniref:Sec39 domain-containing protein n=1 Tax=Podila minutissima TaxID=64525 RepID=A0A9P5SD75_9FUNG|nr:hypothetical protein BG006_002254 [Podila minutissima]
MSKLDAKERASGSHQGQAPAPPGLDTNAILKYQWKQLNHITTDAIATLLKKVTDKEWVLAQCVISISDDHDTIRVLLEHGLQLTETVMDDIIARCELGPQTKIDWIRAAAAGEPLSQRSSQALLAAQLSGHEILACKYRWYLLKYLNRLATHHELTIAEKEARAKEEAKVARIQKPKSSHDPFDPLKIEQEPEPVSNLPLITGTYHSFRDMDLAGQACVFAEAGFVEGIRILFTRHNRETWPWRMAIVGRIPETCPTESYQDLLPQINPSTRLEKEWALDNPWRDMDWAEVAELRTLVFGSPDHEMYSYMEQLALTIEERRAAHGGDEAAVLDMATIQKEAEELLPSPEDFPAPNERLSHWYTNRALAIDRDAGQMIEARRLIQWGTNHHIPHLETISEDLEILCKILYEIKPESRTPESRAFWSSTVLELSLQQFSQMDPMEVVKLCLATTDRSTIVQDIRQLVLPYLTVIIPRRWQRHDQAFAPGLGLPPGLDPNNPMSYLYAYLLSQSPEHLSWVGAVVEASKPVFEFEERILSNDMDLAWLTLSCMYGCRRVDEWKVMSDMIVCLPMFDQTEDVDEAVDKVRRAELRKGIFLPGGGDFIQPTANDRPRIPQQIDPINMYPAFVKYAPTPGLMQHALDTLEQHLTAAETLARYDLPVPLSWFLENSDSEASQKQMITKMARLASGGPEKMGERFESEDEWMLLLEDLIRLRGGEHGGGVLGLASEQDIYREYLAGVLSCGKFGLAKAILFPHGLLPPLRLATAEKLVIDSSNEMYNNATSGNRHQGLMKMAYECLQVLPETTNIRREMDLIEATHFMTSTYNLTAPNTNTTILPLQIRSTENKLSLVRRLIMTKENAYRDHAAMLELAIKLTGSAQKKSAKQHVEIQVVGTLIEAALQEKNYVFAMQQSERLIDLLRITGALDLSPDGSPRMRRLAKSSSSLNVTDPLTSPSLQNKRPPSSVLAAPRSTSQQWNGQPEPVKPWELFLRVGSESAGRDYSKRLCAIGFALASCPADKIESVLEIWRSLEMESVHAPVPEADPRRGVAGFMSTMMDRTGSTASTHSNHLASGHGHGHGQGHGAMDRGGQGPLAEIIGRSRSPALDPRRENTMGSEYSQEGGRRRDKLKSLVGSIWNAS